jgi:cytoskeletal protein RodZ
MKTTGQVLKEARLSLKLELDEVSKNTKIRINFLHQLEADDFSRLPNATVAKGFIRNYAQFLNLNPEQTLAIFRRDFIENEQGQIVPRGFVDPVGRSSIWTPKTTIIAAVFLVFTLFGSYLGYQFWLLKGPPSLSIVSPEAGATTNSPTVEVVGKTDPEATISVNGQLVTLDRGGEFFVRIPLQVGANDIVIEARGKSGKTSSATRSVFLTMEP